MNEHILVTMNAIMADAAHKARIERRNDRQFDLTQIWIATLERLATTVAETEISFGSDVSPEHLKRKFAGKPWSFERFLAYATNQPPV